MGRLCELFSQTLKPQGRVVRELFDWPGDPGPYGASLPLRLAGALHALVLEGHSPSLRHVYPPDHHLCDDSRLWQILENNLDDHADFILRRLQSPPQTNEVRRAGVMLPGYLTIAGASGLPIVLSEIGSSAGLNLLWDQYNYRLGDTSWGKAESAVTIAPEWIGPPPPVAAIQVISRAGCDLLPIDPASAEDRTRLLSYIWADQADRMALTRAALETAVAMPVQVDRENAISWLDKRLSVTHEGAIHVINHTIMWQYMGPSDRQRGRDLIVAAGNRATDGAPLAWLRLEADSAGPGAALMLTLWPTGSEKCIGRADFHGRWIIWTGW